MTVRLKRQAMVNGKKFKKGLNEVNQYEFEELSRAGFVVAERAQLETEPAEESVSEDVEGLDAQTQSILENAGLDLDTALNMSEEELTSIKGIGKATAKKILSL